MRADVPLLLGIQNAMGALKQLKQRRDYALACGERVGRRCEAYVACNDPMPQDFISARQALAAAGIPVVEAALASSAQEAAAIVRKLGQPVALKAEAPGLLHKSDLGCVKLNCSDRERGRRRL